MAKGGTRDVQEKDGADEFDTFLKGKNLLRPDDQLDLTEKASVI